MSKSRIIARQDGDDYVWTMDGEEIARHPVAGLHPGKLKRALKSNKDWERPNGPIGNE